MQESIPNLLEQKVSLLHANVILVNLDSALL